MSAVCMTGIQSATGLKLRVWQTVICLTGDMRLCRSAGNRYVEDVETYPLCWECTGGDALEGEERLNGADYNREGRYD